jgi:hypothetical protein
MSNAYARRNQKQEPPPVPGRVVNNSLMSSHDIDETLSDSTKSKLQRMQDLRRQHQRSHRERSGHYPLEEKEDQYELQIQKYEKVNVRPKGQYNLSTAVK